MARRIESRRTQTRLFSSSIQTSFVPNLLLVFPVLAYIVRYPDSTRKARGVYLLSAWFSAAWSKEDLQRC